MKLLFLFFFTLSCFCCFGQNSGGNPSEGCANDSLKVITDSNWIVVNNTIGKPIGVKASDIPFQLNAMTDFPDARWISCQKDWVISSIKGDTLGDDYMTLRYEFKNCKADTVTIDLLVRRDNYIRIYLDGKMIHYDAPVNNATFYNIGTKIKSTQYLDTCKHTLDFRVYNRNDFTGTNGFGLIVGGYLTAKTNSLFTNNPGCSESDCCNKPSAVLENRKEVIQVYPNPVQETLNINVPQEMLGNTFHIINSIGQCVFSGTLSEKNATVDVHQLPVGLYTLRIAEMSILTKFVKYQ